jgi:LMBR1 domain-containing protein 1
MQYALHNAPPKGYYALFGILSCWVTVVVPFVFSYVRLDEEDMPMCEKVASAAKATVGFAVSLVAVFLVGLAMRPGHSKWSHRPDQHWIKMVLDTDHAGSAAILFTMGCLACAGTVLWLIFTAYGLAALPMALLKGKKALGAARQMGVGCSGAVRWTEKGAVKAVCVLWLLLLGGVVWCGLQFI